MKRPLVIVVLIIVALGLFSQVDPPGMTLPELIAEGRAEHLMLTSCVTTEGVSFRNGMYIRGAETVAASEVMEMNTRRFPRLKCSGPQPRVPKWQPSSGWTPSSGGQSCFVKERLTLCLEGRSGVVTLHFVR